MLKKYSFYILLIILYLFFLSKDSILGIIKNDDTKLPVMHYDYKNEYEKLSRLMDLEVNNYNLLYAKIINRNIYDFYNEITISRGLKDNVSEGMLVIDYKGVVGVVKKVYNNYSEVMLLTNKDINMSVKVNDSYGILSSSDNMVTIKNIKKGGNINIKDKIYTSGLTKIPGDILIGEVVSVELDSKGLEYIINVQLSSNMNDLKYLAVIT